MKKILIAIEIFDDAKLGLVEKIKNYGFQVVKNDSGKELRFDDPLYKDVDYIIAGLEKYDAAFFLSHPNIKAISRVGVGVDNIDLKAASDSSCKILITSDRPSVAVAELCIANMINLLRSTYKMSKCLKEGKWDRIQGQELRNCTVGIIGLGSIGKQVAKRVHSFGSKIIGYGRTWDEQFAKEYGIQKCTIEDLVRQSNVLTIHLPLTKETSNFINKELINMVPQGSIVLNTSRSGVIDNYALRDSLITGKISGAAIDVFSEHRNIHPYEDLENVILTPHIGSHTIETRISMEESAIENIVLFDKLQNNSLNPSEIDQINKHISTHSAKLKL